MFKPKQVLRLLSMVGSTLVAMPVYAAVDALAVPEGALISSGLSPQFVAQCSLFLAILLLGTIFIGKLLKLTLRLPVIAGQIIGGILLGPSLLDIKNMKVFAGPLIAFDWITHELYTLSASDMFVMFILLLSAVFTVPYLMWIAGHETDIKDIIKVGVAAVSAGILGAALPVLMIFVTAYYGLSGTFNVVQALGIGLVLSATSVSIPIAMFFAKNKMHLKTSKATLGAAIIDDIAAVIALSVFFICLQGGTFGAVEGIAVGHYAGTMWQAFVYMIISFAVIFFTGYFIIPPAIRLLRKKKLSHLIASVANGVMFLYFSFAELIGGLSGITGAYFAGLFHRKGDERHRAEKTISPFVNTVLLPLFLGSIGLQVNITILGWYQWGIVSLLLGVAIISKLLGCYAAIGLSNLSKQRRKNRWTLLEGFLFGSSMVARGEVGLVIATILHGSWVLPHDVYVMVVVVIILTTIASPIMLAIGFSVLDLQIKEREVTGEYILNIGLFRVIGSTQMFNIIINKIETSPAFKSTNIQMSEGRRVVNIEGENVAIILSPNEGILFEGNKTTIERILRAVKSSIATELDGIIVR